MSTAELARWANNKSVTTLTNKKKEWCNKQLSKYAEFQLVTGGVIITKIIEPIWRQSARKIVRENYFKYYGHDDVKVDTCVNCYKKMKKDFPDLQITKDTWVAYIGGFRREDFGPVRGKNKGKDGRLGSSCFALGKIVDNEFYFFDEQEQEIKKELEKKYFYEVDMHIVYEIQAATELFKKGEISQEEFNERITDAANEKNWVDFKRELMERIGAIVDFRVKCTENGVKVYAAASKGEFIF